MGKIIKDGIEYPFGGGSGSNMEVVTRVEYDALVAAGSVKTDVYYFISGEDEMLNTVNEINSMVKDLHDKMVPTTIDKLNFLEIGTFYQAIAANGDVTVQITYKKTYDYNPKIIFLGFTGGALTPYLQSHIVHEISNVTTSGFKLRCRNSHSSATMYADFIYALVDPEEWINFCELNVTGA